MANKKASVSVGEAFTRAANILNDTTPQRVSFYRDNTAIYGNLGGVQGNTVLVGTYGKFIDKEMSTDQHRASYTAKDAKAVVDWLNERGVFYSREKGARRYDQST